jgi:hypothetical protein
MSEPPSGRPVLTSGQILDLNYLRLTWTKFYEISCDGVIWTAIPHGTEEAITAESQDGLYKILRVDAYSRVTCSGRWIETASGPAYLVKSSSTSRSDPRE